MELDTLKPLLTTQAADAASDSCEASHLEGETCGNATGHGDSVQNFPALRVTRVQVEGRGAVNNISFTYSDDSKWSVGKPFGDKRKPRWRPLLLADDEYIVEVHHESLRQWWWAAAAVVIKTNKGRMLNARGDWGSGQTSDARIFKADEGCCILRLKIHNGVCHGVVQGPAQAVDEDRLNLWAVYWLPEGLPDGEVQSRNFTGRDSAFSFAERSGCGRGNTFLLGPLRFELEDHPWFDCLQDFSELWSSAFRSRRRGWRHDNVTEEVSMALITGTQMAGVGAEDTAQDVSEGAGLVIDIVRGTRVRAWGPLQRRKPCEELAQEHGQFNLKKWHSRSSSFAAHMDRWKATLPVLRRIASMMQWRQHITASAVMAVSTLVRSVTEGAQPVLTGAIFNVVEGDEALVRKESMYLHWVCSATFGCSPRLSLAKSVIAALLALAMLRGIARVGSQWARKSLKEKYRAQARIELFEHLLVQDLENFEKSSTRGMMKKAQPQTIDQTLDWLMNLMSKAAKLIASLYFLFSISPLMTFIYAAFMPIFEACVHMLLRGQAQGELRREKGMEETAGKVIYEACDMIKTVKTFSREDWHVALQRYAVEGASAARLTMTQAAAQVGEDMLHQSIYCFSLWCGLVWMNKSFSAGEMTAFLLLVSRVSNETREFKKEVNNLLNQSDSLTEYFSFLDQTPTMFPGRHAASVEGHVEVQDVCFNYPARPEQQVLHGVTMELMPGKATALVGASGSGKSTVVALLLRHYDPSKGQILVDGVPLRDWDLAYLHRHTAVVAQEPLLFETTIRQNLLYGVNGARVDESPDEFEEDMIQASKSACAHEFIMKLPAKYDTHVGDRGSQISGGQKQRLAVARAMLVRPRILILDEATSALDAESEGIVQAAIDRLVADSGSSVLMIAHRLSTVKDCDQIICLRDGVVIERGSPRELLEQQGYYYKLVSRQVITLDDIKGTNVELDRCPASTTSEVGNDLSKPAKSRGKGKKKHQTDLSTETLSKDDEEVQAVLMPQSKQQEVSSIRLLGQALEAGQQEG